MQPAPTPENIHAIVITYHPDDGLYERIKCIQQQVNEIIIVDNHSSENCLAMIKKISSELGVKLILNKSNRGIAEALNQGVRYVVDCENTFHWILTLDQDSMPFPSMVPNLIAAYNGYPFKERVGIIGSNYREKTTNKVLFQEIYGNKTWAEVENLPTSGSLISTQAWRDVGPFRDDFFIDYVDTEYCMRLRNKGYRVLISPKVGMIHPLGYYRVSKLHKLLRGSSMITNYPPFRHYYWTRNGVILILENLWRDTNWSLNEAYYLFFRRIITILLFEDKKLIKIGNICLGVWHALISRRGIKK